MKYELLYEDEERYINGIHIPLCVIYEQEPHYYIFSREQLKNDINESLKEEAYKIYWYSMKLELKFLETMPDKYFIRTFNPFSLVSEVQNPVEFEKICKELLSRVKKYHSSEIHKINEMENGKCKNEK